MWFKNSYMYFNMHQLSDQTHVGLLTISSILGFEYSVHLMHICTKLHMWDWGGEGGSSQCATVIHLMHIPYLTYHAHTRTCTPGPGDADC